MIFSSLTFLIFFIVVMFPLVVLKNQKSKKTILLLSSYFFYGYWDYRFLSLIIFSTVVDYIAGSKIYKSDSQKEKKVYLTISMCVNLGLLGFFKTIFRAIIIGFKKA